MDEEFYSVQVLLLKKCFFLEKNVFFIILFSLRFKALCMLCCEVTCKFHIINVLYVLYNITVQAGVMHCVSTRTTSVALSSPLSRFGHAYH